ncbi:MAG TPA: DNA mismatch repair endonuclease MutL [Prolixibacteraceae bacterium]|nr:DNA mismatch repair endonuclease MutL [Prolixibacteraceae bacterium]
MPDIIQLLPDSVANQIAAGEVIQRPASVVKELVENAIDAGATTITINIKDSGRTLIQVIDNGKGMSPTDARMSFERHATSKIREANDLFAIRTMGFRGEALASIAGVADVELRTRLHGEELGTFIHILGSVIQKQEADQCAEGTNFSVKNIFFNIPARRKFLKSNSSELKYIITEVQRVALANPGLAIELYHNNSVIYNLPSENVRKRIVSLFGKMISQSLIPVDTITSVINVSGFIGQPKYAKKTLGEQFFFVNGRFMKHPFFNRAVQQAYDRILPPETFPSYFLYFEVDPATIDINIHPTKTEIKFEDERSAWHIIQASVREAMGKFNLMPSIDFDQAGSIDIPLSPIRGSKIPEPEIRINPNFNPFEQERGFDRDYSKATSYRDGQNLDNWQALYKGFEQEGKPDEQIPVYPSDISNEIEQEAVQGTFSDEDITIRENHNFLQFKNKYIITPVKSGLMVIDQRRAHERILFENFMRTIDNHLAISQRQLFPAMLELNAVDKEILIVLDEELKALGFEIRQDENGVFLVEGIPALLSHLNASDLVQKLIEDFKNRPVDVKEEIKEHLALLLSQSTAINYGVSLKPEEISDLFNHLFACQTPNYSPSGKTVVSIISFLDFEKLL